jgi:hypothetical protein
MYGYAGLTLLVYYAGTGEVRLPRQGVVGPAYRSRIWPTAISGIQKSTKGSYPYNQGRRHPSMEEDHGDRVHSGGLTTITVLKYSPYLTMVRSQWKQVQDTGMVSLKEICPRGKNNIVIIIFLVYDNVYTPCYNCIKRKH